MNDLESAFYTDLLRIKSSGFTYGLISHPHKKSPASNIKKILLWREKSRWLYLPFLPA
jgi:hypothetical protein